MNQRKIINVFVYELELVGLNSHDDSSSPS